MCLIVYNMTSFPLVDPLVFTAGSTTNITSVPTDTNSGKKQDFVTHA